MELINLKMSKRIILLFLMLSVFSQLKAQKTISGNVFDFENKIFPLEKVSVRNLKNKAFAITSDKGRFTIEANPGDILEFTQIGYYTDTVLLINLLSKTVFMVPRRNDIDGVDINGVKLSPYLDWKDPNAETSKKVSTDGLRHKGNNDRAGGISLALGYGKYRREQEKADALEEQEYYETEIRENFNEKKIFQILKVSGQDAKDFMGMFRPTVNQVKLQRPFNYSYYIVTAYSTWLKLPEDQRRLPPLPKLKDIL